MLSLGFHKLYVKSLGKALHDVKLKVAKAQSGYVLLFKMPVYFPSIYIFFLFKTGLKYSGVYKCPCLQRIISGQTTL